MLQEDTSLMGVEQGTYLQVLKNDISHFIALFLVSFFKVILCLTLGSWTIKSQITQAIFYVVLHHMEGSLSKIRGWLVSSIRFVPPLP